MGRLVSVGMMLLLAAGPDALWGQSAGDRGRIRSADGRVPQVGRRLRNYERDVNDFLLWENVPNATSMFRGVPMSFNRWGMRDVDYERVPPTGVFRIALLGSSMTVGAGAPLEQTMESLLEARLNRDWPRAPGRRVEILNFSVGGYGILQNVAVAERKALPFRPDAMLVGVFSNETIRMPQFLFRLVKSRQPIPYPALAQKLRQAGVRADMEEPELRRRLRPVAVDLVRWSYARLVQLGREKGIPVLGLVLPEPLPRRGRNIDEVASLAASARLPLLDLRGVYSGRSEDELRLGGSDDAADPHWNAAGHRLISDRIFQLLRENDDHALRLESNFKKSK